MDAQTRPSDEPCTVLLQVRSRYAFLFFPVLFLLMNKSRILITCARGIPPVLQVEVLSLGLPVLSEHLFRRGDRRHADRCAPPQPLRSGPATAS